MDLKDIQIKDRVELDFSYALKDLTLEQREKVFHCFAEVEFQGSQDLMLLGFSKDRLVGVFGSGFEAKE